MSIKWRLAQRLELLWWKRYLRGKSKAEYLEWKRSYWKLFFEKIADVVAVQPQHSVIEYGCGPAGCFTLFSQNKIIAVDPLIDKYDANLPHFEKGDYPNTTFIGKPIEGYTPTQKADVVLCMNAINHVRNIDVALDVLCNSVDRGGVLVMSVDAHNYGLLKWLFRLIPGDALHPHQYDAAAYCKMLADRNFQIVIVQKVKKAIVFSYYVMVAKPQQ